MSPRLHSFHIDVASGKLETDGPGGVIEELATIAASVWNADEMLRDLPRVMYERDKYDTFLPDDLLVRSFASQHLDVDGARNALCDSLKAIAGAESSQTESS